MPGEGYHIPVMSGEVLENLITDRSGLYVDATLGGGGHSRSILDALAPEGKVLGLDRDPEAVACCREAKTGRLTIVQENFGNVDAVLNNLGISGIQGILYDLGVSSRQLDSKARGFSYRSSQLLDMRMNPDGKGDTAADILNSSTPDRLARIFRDYADLTWARSLARAAVRFREKERFSTSDQLARVVAGCRPGKLQNKNLSRVFQALRIEVNRELEALEYSLEKIMGYISVGGRIVVIAYHSLEDRIVKHFFRDRARGCVCPPRLVECRCGKTPEVTIQTPRPLMPGASEQKENPRSRSARMRVAEKIEGGR